MGALDKVRELVTRGVESGQERVADVRTGRERGRLFEQLGKACYATSKGVSTSDGEVERLVAEIDKLDAPAQDVAEESNDQSAPADKKGDES